MLYQFMDWRIGLHRRMYMFDVEKLFTRLRESNGGQLPFSLVHYEHVLIFAGEAGIALPEMQTVAESLIATDAYPDVEWLKRQYQAFIEWMGNHTNPEYARLLDDPKPPPKFRPQVQAAVPNPPTPAPENLTPPPAAETFGTIVEGSISNTADQQCLEPSPQTVSPTSTFTDSPNSSSTGKKRLPQPQRR